MGYEDEKNISTVLESGERLLWSGKPKQGVLFRPSDLFLVPFSLMWCAFAIFWECSAWSMGAPFLFKIWGIPFVLVGLHMVFGRFVVDSMRRAKTHYGLTSRRILIVSAGRTKNVRSLNLRTLSDLSSTENADGAGTIYFGRTDFHQEMLVNFQIGGSANAFSPRFEQIENVKEVYDRISKTQQQAQ